MDCVVIGAVVILGLLTKPAGNCITYTVVGGCQEWYKSSWKLLIEQRIHRANAFAEQMHLAMEDDPAAQLSKTYFGSLLSTHLLCYVGHCN